MPRHSRTSLSKIASILMSCPLSEIVIAGTGTLIAYTPLLIIIAYRNRDMAMTPSANALDSCDTHFDLAAVSGLHPDFNKPSDTLGAAVVTYIGVTTPHNDNGLKCIEAMYDSVPPFIGLSRRYNQFFGGEHWGVGSGESTIDVFTHLTETSSLREALLFNWDDPTLLAQGCCPDLIELIHPNASQIAGDATCPSDSTEAPQCNSKDALVPHSDAIIARGSKNQIQNNHARQGSWNPFQFKPRTFFLVPDQYLSRHSNPRLYSEFIDKKHLSDDGTSEAVVAVFRPK